MMANNNGVNSVETLTAVADAISAVDSRNQALNQKRRWRGFWSSFWCFGAKQQANRINPERNVPGNVSQPVDVGNPPTTLSLSILAPPSSPASILNSSNPSSAQSPAGFFSLSAISASVYSPSGSTSTMFITGPYAHETQLVSPPVFSTLTTEPSTAPFTPPPESVHLTTPSSPEVPFAQLFASSLDAKSAAKKNGLTLASPLTSPRYVANKDLQAAYQLYPGSPASHLISPKSAVSGSGTSSPFPDLEFPARWSTHSGQESLFPKYDPSKIFNLEKVPPRTLILSQDSEASCFGTSEGFRLDTAKWIFQSNIHCGSEQYSSTSLSDLCCLSGEDMQQKRVTVTCDSRTANEAGRDSSNKSEMEQLEANRASFGLSASEVLSACGRHSEDAGNRFLGSQLGAQKYLGDYASRGRCSRSTETQIAQLAFSDSGTNSVSTDCFFQSIEAQARKDSGNGLRSSVVLESFLTETNVDCSFDVAGGESQVTCSGRSSLGCSERQHVPGDADKSQFYLSANQKYSCVSATKELSHLNDSNCRDKIDEVHPNSGEFKFDKVNKNDDLSMNGELWVDHNKEKVTAESGRRNWSFFHMMPSEVG